MSKKKIFVLGAGLAGLSAAWHLQRKGRDCLVFEKEGEVGGLCRSKRLGGFTFDLDGHLLHFKHQATFNLVYKLLNGNLAQHRRSAFIYHNGQYIRYPFQANLYGLPSSVSKACLLGFIKASFNGHLKKRKNSSFLDWINGAFGRGIAQHFMIPYNKKFWTMAPEKLTCEWLDGFIPTPTLLEVIKGAFKDNKEEFGYNAKFWYPKKGAINNLPLALARQIKNIRINCSITEIDLDRREVKLSTGDKARFDILISTLPLPEVSRLLKNPPSEIQTATKKLKWNSIFNLNLGVEGKRCLSQHWVYFPHKEVVFFRVGFAHNFSSRLAPSNMSSLYVEVAYSKEKPIDKKNIVSHILRDLKEVKILKNDDIIHIKDSNDIKYGYPIYDRNYRPAREKILKFLNQKGVLCCGRYGSWRYLSMEDTLLDGKKVAQCLLSRKS